jgi:hypothetical protein
MSLSAQCFEGKVLAQQTHECVYKERGRTDVRGKKVGLVLLKRKFFPDTFLKGFLECQDRRHLDATDVRDRPSKGTQILSSLSSNRWWSPMPSSNEQGILQRPGFSRSNRQSVRYGREPHLFFNPAGSRSDATVSATSRTPFCPAESSFGVDLSGCDCSRKNSTSEENIWNLENVPFLFLQVDSRQMP